MIPIVLPEGWTRADLVRCVDREIRHREKAYPRWVQLGRMSAKQMQHELAAMKAVLAVLRQPEEPPVQPALFGGSR